VKTRRDFLIALGAGALVAPLSSSAQQTVKMARIGFLGVTTAAEWASRVEALRAGLRDLGYFEGKNIAIEYRWAEGKYDRLPRLAAELVRLKVDVLVVHGTPGTLAAKQATATIPIVMAHIGDAVATGIVGSLARPDGNITGSTFFNPELMAKLLELLKEAIPRMTQVAVLLNPDNPVNSLILAAMESAAKALKVGLQQFEARGPHEFDGVFAAMANRRVNAVVANSEPIFIASTRRMADLAIGKRLALAGSSEFAESGGMIGYWVNFPELYRRVAYFVDRILKGSKPGDLPIERATKFELVVNMKTAKALGIAIPQSVLFRADKVIE
jgi:putative ABC transport system substrate-binding protein